MIIYFIPCFFFSFPIAMIIILKEGGKNNRNFIIKDLYDWICNVWEIEVLEFLYIFDTYKYNFFK